MNIFEIILLISVLFILKIECFPYTLPGDANWPSLSNFNELKANMTGKVILRGESGYNPHTWNLITNTPKPAAIVQPLSSQDVIWALQFAKYYNIRISVQSTGHHQDHRNIYDNSIHFDMSSLNFKRIDLNKNTLTLGPGNNFSQIQKYVASQSNKTLVTLCGADPGVGIYGWSVGGGHGALTRLFGLGVDALLSIDLVLSNNTVITASNDQNQELFRALRGSGGGTFGIAVSLTIQLYNDPGKVSTFQGIYELSAKTASMFATWMISAPKEASAYYLPNNLQDKYVYISAQCFGNASFCSAVLLGLQRDCFPTAGVTCTASLEKYQNFYDWFSNQVSDVGGVAYLTSTALNSSNINTALQEITLFIAKNPYTGCSANAVLGP